MITWADGTPIPVTRFPDNTTQVWKLDLDRLGGDGGRQTIVWDYAYEGELIELAQIKDLLDAFGVERVYLQIAYLPFARQDKPVTNESTFALRSFAKLLNALNFEEIFIVDPHSEVALELIDRSTAVYPHGPVQRVYAASASDVVCYPDAGAIGKYNNLYKFPNVVWGSKTRDQSTGRILFYALHGEVKGKRVLIVDDICDGGATFTLLADSLYKAGAQVVNLFVTHGIFSKGLRPLHQANIVHIYTARGEAVNGVDGIVYKELP